MQNNSKLEALFNASLCVIALLGPGNNPTEGLASSLKSMSSLTDSPFYILIQPISVIDVFNEHCQFLNYVTQTCEQQ